MYWSWLYLWIQDQENQAQSPNVDSGEVLDTIITRSRGEIRQGRSPKVTSSSPSPMKSVYSPRLTQMAQSPRLHEIRREVSREIKQTPSPRPSTLGQTSRGSSSSWSMYLSLFSRQSLCYYRVINGAREVQCSIDFSFFR